jgi:hypothetical protein
MIVERGNIQVVITRGEMLNQGIFCFHSFFYFRSGTIIIGDVIYGIESQHHQPCDPSCNSQCGAGKREWPE